MKQYWRVTTIRAIFGVLLGMLVLGRYYYPLFPILADLQPSILAAITLSLIFLLIFLIAGYVYDARLKLWNERLQITKERDPYGYVPQPRFLAIEYPFLYSTMYFLKRALRMQGTSTKWISDLAEYMSEYFTRDPNSKRDLFDAEIIAEHFNATHPIKQDAEMADTRVGIRSRIKRGFQLEVWRLTWVQTFTGLGQDVLVFAALYIGILFPTVVDPITETVPVDYLLFGIVFISIPLFAVMVAFGWVYDRILRLWSPDSDVKIERNPYSYVPSPRIQAFSTPFFYGMLGFFKTAMKARGLDTTEIDSACRYLDDFMKLSARRESDMALSRQMSRDLGPLFTSSNETTSNEEVSLDGS